MRFGAKVMSAAGNWLQLFPWSSPFEESRKKKIMYNNVGSQDGYGQTTRNRAEQGGRNCGQEIRSIVNYNLVHEIRNKKEIAQNKKEVAKTQEEINKIFEIVQELQEKMGTTARTTEYNKKEMKK